MHKLLLIFVGADAAVFLNGEKVFSVGPSQIMGPLHMISENLAMILKVEVEEIEIKSSSLANQEDGLDWNDPVIQEAVKFEAPTLQFVAKMEGGLVDGFYCQNTYGINSSLTTLDYDVEGADKSEIKLITQPNGTSEEAIVNHHKMQHGLDVKGLF